MENCRKKIMDALAVDKDITYANLMAKVGKECEKYFSPQAVESMRGTVATGTESTCGTIAKEYGFDKIKADRVDKDAQNSVANVLECTSYFCTHDQLQIYLSEQYRQIADKIKTENIACTETRMLSELYKEAGTFDVNVCNETTKTGTVKIYLGDNMEAVSKPYKLTATAEQKVIPSMITVLNTVKDTSVLVKFKANDTYNSMFDKIAKKSGDYYYMTANNYKILIKKANDTTGTDGKQGCGDLGKPCEIKDFCGVAEITLENKAFEYLAGSASGIEIIDAVSAEKPTAEEIEMVYNANAKLYAIHKLAVFDTELKSGTHNDLLLTAMEFSEANAKTFTDWAESFDAQIGAGKTLRDFIATDKHTLSFTDTSAAVGQYKTQIDFNYCKTDNKTADIVKMTKRNEVTDAKNSEKNILLKKAFNLDVKTAAESVNARGAIIDSQGNFYTTVPVKLTASPIAGETGLIYNIRPGNPSSLIEWKNQNNVTVAPDSRNPSAIRNVNPNADQSPLIASITPTATAQTLQGIYYYTEGTTLVLQAGQKPVTYTAERVGFEAGATQTVQITKGGTNEIRTLETVINEMPKLSDIVEMVKTEKACISTDGSNISWNETELLK